MHDADDLDILLARQLHAAVDSLRPGADSQDLAPGAAAGRGTHHRYR